MVRADNRGVRRIFVFIYKAAPCAYSQRFMHTHVLHGSHTDLDLCAELKYETAVFS